MPIIKDPKMNHRELSWGIIEVNGIHCFYEKESLQNKKRFMPFGWKIALSDISCIRPVAEAKDWNGIPIKFQAIFNEDVVEKEPQGRVTRFIYDTLSAHFPPHDEDFTTELK